MREARYDGRKALAILREHYLGRSKPRIIGIYHELCSLNIMNYHESTTDYILRAEQAAAALKTAGEEVSDALLVAMIIKGLPQTSSTFSAFSPQQSQLTRQVSLSLGQVPVGQVLNLMTVPSYT